MTQDHKTIGALVELHPNCFKEPLAPHYDHLKDVVFEVVGVGHPGHVLVRPLSGSQKALMLHDENIKTVSSTKKRKN